jgi:hypothetical protein
MNLFKKNKVNYTKEIEIVGGPYCYGIKNKRTGTMVSPKIFQEISDFYDGLAIIKQHPGGGMEGNWLGVIDDIRFIDYGNSLFVIHVCDRGGKNALPLVSGLCGQSRKQSKYRINMSNKTNS